MDYARSEHLRKRKKWIDTLVTSSEEDNVDEVKPSTKIDSNQPIALRFPYLMISDDSGEEEEFKCYCDGINTVMPSIRKKRKHTSQEPIVESDKRTIGGNTETYVIGRNGKRKYSSSDNEQDESVHCHKRIKSKRILTNSDLSKNFSENKPMRTLDILKTENVSRDSKSNVLVNSSSPSRSLKSVGNTTIQQGIIHSSLDKNSKFLLSSDDESTYDKEIYAVAGKKKINKKLKSNGSRAQRYKRLHVISPSSSDDEDDNKRHNRLSNKKTNESVHSGLRKKKPNHVISSSSSYSGDDSNTNNVSNQDTRDKNKENKVLPKEIYQNIHPCPNLLNSLKTESQQPTKKEEVKKPMNLINLNRPTTSSNINSNAWKKIANADVKQKTNPLKQGNTLNITDLKKKFASSNISSVELHKQINEKSLNNNKKIKHLSLGTKNKSYSSKKPTYLKSNDNSNVKQVESDYRENEITNKATTDHLNERKQPPENKYTVNVNVYCNSPQQSGNENNLIPVDSVTSASETLIASENPNVDINLLLHGNSDDNILAEPNKKIRVSRVNQEIKKPLHQTKSCFTKNNPLQTKKAFKKDITSDENKNENNGTKNVSNSYDVLGSILSEMNNNPFKIDKPIKKHEDIKPDDLGWSPNPLFFGRNQGYNLETSNLQIATKPTLQTGSLHNKPLLVGPSMPTSASNLVSPSGSDLKDTNNTDSGKMKTQQKGSDNSNNRSSVIKKFYSTNSKENTGKTNPEQHTVTSSINIALWKKQIDDSISSTKNKQSGENNRSCSGKKPILSENVSKNFTSSNSKVVEECDDVRADSRFHQNEMVDQIPDKPANLSNDTQLSTKTKRTRVSVKDRTTSLDNEIVNKMSEKPEHLPNVTTEAKTLKDTSLENECSANDNNTKGIRIKVGGTIFRLPGKPNSCTETINPTTDDIIPDNCLNNRDNDRSSSSNISTTVNSSTICNPGNNSSNTNLINKHDSKTILDGSDDSEDSSDSSDSGSSEDSSDSGDSENQNQSAEEQNANDKSFTKKHLTGQNKIKELKNSTSCDNVKAQLPSTSTSKQIEVIVLSDSSESENSQCKEAIVNRKEEDSVEMSSSNSSELKSLPNEEKDDNIDDSKVKFIGKIRVKSLRELGLEEEKPLAANAIPSGTSGSLTDTSSEQSQLQLNQLKTAIIISPSLQANPNNMVNDVHSNSTQKNWSTVIRTQIKSNKNSCSNQSSMPSISNKPATIIKDHTGNFGTGRTILTTKSTTHAVKQSTRNELAIKTTKQKLQRKKTTEIPVSLYNERQMVAVQQTKTNEQPLQTEVISKAISEPKIQELPNKSNAQTVLLLLSQNTVLPNVQSLPSQTELGKETEPQQSDSESVETKFISLCDTLFIDLVYYKIPKLVDDLHLVIIHDRLKEERIKNLEQLISPDIIASEKNRAEKDFGETLRIRGQSFVPLLMTIVNKIEKENLQTLVIALYCRIVQHLERIDSRNAEYKFKLKNIIKRMLQKHISSELENVLLVFNSDEESFATNFKFIENLLHKYDVILGERQRDQLQNQPVTHCTQSSSSNENTENVSNLEHREDEVVSNANCTEPPDNNLTVRKPVKKYVVCQINSTGANLSKNSKMEIISPAWNKNNIKSSSSNQNNHESMSTSSSTPQPLNVNLIGNLDSLIFKKTLIFK